MVASYLRRCKYIRSVLVMSTVPNLHVLCSRRYTAVSVDIQATSTSKMDSAQNFGVESVLELLL